MAILAYHSISDDWEHPLSVRSVVLREQIRMIASSVIPLQDYVRRFETGSLTGDEHVLTFDDGYLDNFENALPILEELGAPATVFVPSHLVGDASDFGTGAEPRPLMTWPQLRKMATSGIEVGAHSATHRDMRRLDAEQLRIEAFDSKARLEEMLDSQVEFFCYPAGYYSPPVVSMVRDAGYRAAVVTPRGLWGRQSQFLLRRVGIYRHDDSVRFRVKLSAAGQAVRWLILATRSAMQPGAR